MRIRYAKEHEVDEILSWWPRQHVSAPPKIVLYPNLVVAQDDNDQLLAAVSFYLEQAGVVAFIAYVAANPDAGIKKRSVALDELFLAIEQHAAKLGYKVLECFTPTRAISKRLMCHGFAAGDMSVTHFIKGLQHERRIE
jgi:hypothetical protein